MINELRLGNLTNFGKVIEINKVSFYVIDEKGEQAKSTWADIQPIPLTEEWLLNLGYIHSPSCHYVIKGHLIWKPADFLCCDKTGIILKHVHQLQNLYFALTNQELTIKQ